MTTASISRFRKAIFSVLIVFVLGLVVWPLMYDHFGSGAVAAGANMHESGRFEIAEGGGSRERWA
jgi:hypothetical protein